jgi:hypothetical protein
VSNFGGLNASSCDLDLVNTLLMELAQGSNCEINSFENQNQDVAYKLLKISSNSSIKIL